MSRTAAAAGAAAFVLLALAARPAVEETAHATRGGEIVFERATTSGCQSEIWLMNADGSGQRRLPFPAGACSPRWSPDGRAIVFARPRLGLFVSDVDGTALRRVTTGPDREPDWSPDQRRLVFQTSGRRELRSEVYLAESDGRRVRLAGGSWRDETPDWSPDGRAIAFISDREHWAVCPRCGALCVIAPDRTAFRRLTTKGIDARAPAWSPDGRSLAWARRRGTTGAYALVVMTADAHALREVAGSGTDPAWSPDGRALVFSRDGNLHRVNRDGTGLRRLTYGRRDRNPDWRPAR